jgi:hypothetical protein
VLLGSLHSEKRSGMADKEKKDNTEKDNTEAVKILSAQLGEHNQFARTNIQLLVQWFIFFATANYVVIGYFVLKMADAPLSRPGTFYWVAALFVTVNVIASVLCWHARLWFGKSAAAVDGTLRMIQQLSDSPSELVAAPLPYRDYARVAVLMCFTVLTMLGTWIAIVANARGSQSTTTGQQLAPIQVYCSQSQQVIGPSQSSKKGIALSSQAQVQIFCAADAIAPTQPALVPSPLPKPSPKGRALSSQ